MKTALIAICLIMTQVGVIAKNMGSIVEEWRNELPSTSDKSTAVAQLQNRLENEFSDPETRLKSLHGWVLSTQDPHKRTENGMLLMAMWSQIAPPDVRAKVISSIIRDTNEPLEITILETYLRTDLTDIEKIKSANDDELNISKHGSRAEKFYNASHYTSEGVENSMRLAALLFSIAPASALMDYAKIGADNRIDDLVNRIEKLRRSTEAERNWETNWEELQSLLAELAQLDESAIDAYLARIVAWGRNLAPQLEGNLDVLAALKERDNDLVRYLLHSNDPNELVSIEASSKPPFETAAVLKVEKTTQPPQTHHPHRPPKKISLAKRLRKKNPHPSTTNPKRKNPTAYSTFFSASS